MIKVSNFSDRPYRILNPGDSPDLQAFIDQAEADYLKKLAGIEFYNALVAGLATDPVPAKWTALKVGADYTYQSKLYRFEGLVKMLVPLIYSLWLTEGRDKVTTSGPIITNADKSDHLSPAWRITKDFNTFARMAGGRYAQRNTMYGFLLNSEDDYGTLVWCEPKPINEFGL